jgi:hypothetical protein
MHEKTLDERADDVLLAIHRGRICRATISGVIRDQAQRIRELEEQLVEHGQPFDTINEKRGIA